MDFKKTILSALVVIAMSLNSLAFAGCSACQAAAAARKSKQEALAAALAAGKSVSREMELDAVDFADKCVIEACCDYCKTYGVNCDGEYSGRCNACQAAKKSQQDALAAALAMAAAATNKVAKRLQLDTDAARAPREALEDPCNTCPSCTDEINVCQLNQQLEDLAECCVYTNKQLKHQRREAEKCCKQIKHEIHEVEELLVSVIDTSANCCSVIETAIGDPVASAALPVPACGLDSSIVDLVNAIDTDTLSWLKSLYVLLYNVYSCTCCD